MSSLNAVKALNDANVNVKGMIAVFTYAFELAEANFKNANVDLTTLSDYNHLLDQALKDNYITEKRT
jgi:orotate phosphoribosyltransferase